MQNSERLQELYNASLNSNGAANEQYGKTLESLETKLTRLKNAWNEFTTGLLNNDVIKFGVDILNKIMETINKLTNLTGNSVIDTISKITLLIGTLALAKVAIKALGDMWTKKILEMKAAAKSAGEAGEEGDKAGKSTINNLGKKLVNSLASKTTRKNVSEAINGNIKGIWDKIVSFFTKSLPKLGSIIMGVLSKIGTAITGFFSSIAFPITIIIAAITTAAILIYKEVTKLERAIKATAQAIEDTKEQVDALTSSYNEANSAFQDVVDQTEALDDIVAGTNEWYEAQEKLNQSIDDLVEKYPELEKYVQISADGTKSFEGYEEAVEAEIKLIQERASQAKVAQYALEKRKNQLELQKETEDNYSGSDDAIALRKSIAQNTTMLQAEIKKQVKDELSEQEQSYLNKVDLSSTYIEAEKEARQEMNGLSKNELKELKENYAKDTYGTDAEIKGNKIIYYVEGEDGEKEKKTVKFEDNDWKAILASQKAMDKLNSTMTELPSKINSIFNQLSVANKAFSKAMTVTDVDELSMNDYEDMYQDFDKLIAAINARTDLEEGEKTDLINALSEQMNAAGTAYNQTFVKTYSNSIIEALKNASMGSAQAYIDKIRKLETQNDGSLERVNAATEKLTKYLPEESKNSFFESLAGQSDWGDIDLSTFSQELYDVGVSIPESELRTYLNLLKQECSEREKLNAIGAQNVYNLESLSKEYLKTGVLSSDNYKALQEAYDAAYESQGKTWETDFGADFIQNMNGSYTYVGDNIRAVYDVVDNIENLMKQSIANKNNEIELSTLLNVMEFEDDMGNKFEWKDIASNAEYESQYQTILQAFQDSANTRDIVVNVAGFTNQTDVSTLTLEEMQTIVSELGKLIKDKATVETEYKKDINDLIAYYATQNSYENFTKYINPARKGNNVHYEDDLTSDEQEEIEARYKALRLQAEAYGINTTEFLKLVEAWKKGEVISSRVDKAASKLVNKVAYKQMNENMEESLEKLIEFSEEYENIVDGNVLRKSQDVSEILKDVFDYDVEITQEATADMYAELIDGILEGNMEDFSTLIGYMSKAAGLTGNAFTTNFTEWGEKELAFFNKMVDAGFGRITERSDGALAFIWSKSSELITNLKEAGGNLELWESPYTWLYNYNERINSQIRERERLERKYTKAVENSSKSVQDLTENTQKEISVINSQISTRTQGAQRAVSEIEYQMLSNAKFANFVRYDGETNELSVDWRNVRKQGWYEEEGQDFEEFVATLEENRDTIIDSIDAIEDLEDDLEEIKNRGRDEYSDLLDAVKEGWVDEKQDEIDKLQEINDTIEESQNKLLNSMREQIEEERQARTNQKTEQSIEDKRLRLAYLQRDTSGANAVEIAALQKEIGEDEEAYTDSLIDQRFDEIEKANEEAAQQRQTQIDIQQSQLDAFKDSEGIWAHIQNIVDKDLIDYANGSMEWQRSQTKYYASYSEGGKNPIEKALEAQNFESTMKAAASYLTRNGEDGFEKEFEAAMQTLSAAQQSLATLSTKDFGNKTTLSIDFGTGSDGGFTLTLNGNELEGVNSKINPEDNVVSDVPTIKTDSTANKSHGSSTLVDGIEVKEKQDWTYVYDRFAGMTESDLQGSSLTHIKSSQTIRDEKEAEEKAEAEKKAKTPYEGKIERTNLKFNTQNRPGVINLTDLLIETLNGTKMSSSWVYQSGAGASVETVAKNQNLIKEIKDTRTLAQLSAISPVQEGTLYRVINDENQLYGYATALNKKWYKINTTKVMEHMNKTNKESLVYGDYKLWAYKSGGLADFTGPAWLDGTKSSPELVLNAQDTQNFIALKDILASILSNNTSTDIKKSSGGDNYYDINIEVDEVASDYDVDQIADRIKEIIYEDATYRNVSIINSVK